MDLDQYHTLQAADDKARQKGAWAGAPALAASNVNMTNTSGKPLYVSVSGGTVTAIKIDNVAQAGLISGRFRLRRNQTISITYSVAPTVTWTYE
jgi:hypothetical protein